MRIRALTMTPLLAVAAASAQGEVRLVDTAPAALVSGSVLSPRIEPPVRSHRAQGAKPILPGRIAQIWSMAGGIDAPPLGTMLPGGMWRGRLRGFGAAGQAGLSGTVARARSICLYGSEADRPVAGYLATELRYGVGLDRDNLLTLDFGRVSQRMPALRTLGLRKAVRARSLYLGATLVHDRRLALSGGWFRLSSGPLSALNYAIERSAGMPESAQGMRLGGEWRLDAMGGQAPARIGFEWRESDSVRDTLFANDSRTARDHRLLLRFSQSF